MKTYTLEMRTAGPSWHHEFEIMSDEMARSLTKKWCTPDNLPRSCTSVTLFDEERVIAQYTITQYTITPSVVEEVIG